MNAEMRGFLRRILFGVAAFLFALAARAEDEAAAPAPVAAEDTLQSSDLRVDLTPRSLGDTKEGKTGVTAKFLRLGPIYPKDLGEVAGGLLSIRKYALSVPVFVASDKVQLIINNKPVEAEKGGAPNLRIVKMEIDDREQCRELLALDENFATENYELCVAVADKALDYVGGLTGPFQYRKPYGFWAQAGSSIITQVVHSSNQSSGLFDARQVGVRAGAGAWWRSLAAEAYFRRALVELSSASFAPQWTGLSLGYGWELPKFWEVTPHITALAGFELYQNKVENIRSRYISSYQSPLIGFRSRFVIKSRLETGGDLLFIYAGSGSSKLFIQGDMRYWLTPSFALGGGYWVDNARRDRGTSHFNETSLAIETYLRYTR